jgi:hypothetical protein
MWIQNWLLIGVVIVFAILNGLAWLIDAPSYRYRFGQFSAGFLLGALGIAAWLYGYSQAR